MADTADSTVTSSCLDPAVPAGLHLDERDHDRALAARGGSRPEVGDGGVQVPRERLLPERAAREDDTGPGR